MPVKFASIFRHVFFPVKCVLVLLRTIGMNQNVVRGLMMSQLIGIVRQATYVPKYLGG